MATTKVVEVAKPMKMPPTLRLSEEELPDIKDWKVGGKYTITLEVEQTGSHKGDTMMPMMEGESKPAKISAEFKVLKAYAGEEPEGEDDTKETEDSSEPPKMSENKPSKVAEAFRRKLT